MQQSIEKLNQLRNELTEITKEVQKGTLPSSVAADKIIHVREEMDKIIDRLKSMTKK